MKQIKYCPICQKFFPDRESDSCPNCATNFDLVDVYCSKVIFEKGSKNEFSNS